MRKTLSSLFILMLLSLVLWGVFSWVLGNKSKDSIEAYFKHETTEKSGFLDFKLASYESMLFGANAKLLVNTNSQNKSFKLLGDLFEAINIDVKIINGPVFIDKSGVSFGRSKWIISLNQEYANPKVTNLLSKYLKDKNLDNFKVTLLFNFDEEIEYEVPFYSNNSEITMQGSYSPKNQINKGDVVFMNTSFENIDYRFEAKEVSLEYQIVLNESMNNRINWSMKIPELTLQHSSFNEILQLQSVIDSRMSLNDELLDSDINIYFKNQENSIYHIDRSDVKLNISDLNTHKIINLLRLNDEIDNVKQEIEWVLEEQSELPEGQAKLWRLQDGLKNQLEFKKTLISNVLLSDSNTKSKVNFSIKSYSDNKNSYLNGVVSSVKPYVDSNKPFPDEQITEQSLMEIVEVNAKVALDNVMYKFISSKLPIKGPEFKLVYKSNKLLMQ